MAIERLMMFLATTITPQLVEVIWDDGKWGGKNMGEFGWRVVWLGKGGDFGGTWPTKFLSRRFRKKMKE